VLLAFQHAEALAPVLEEYFEDQNGARSGTPSAT
jgi:hypothetical protein